MNIITKSDNHKRIDITLPQETIKLLERISKKGDRSGLVDQAIRFYAKEMNRAKLRKELNEGATARYQRDLDLANDWFFLENEVWPEK
jgi:CopG family transcriptional regulator/antitoxin EndoAI